LDHAVLDLDGAADGIDYASELNKDAVSRPLNDAPVMHRNRGIEQIAAERPQPGEGPFLVGGGKLAVSGYICRKYGCEFSRLGHGSPSTGEESITGHRS